MEMARKIGQRHRGVVMPEISPAALARAEKCGKRLPYMKWDDGLRTPKICIDYEPLACCNPIDWENPLPLPLPPELYKYNKDYGSVWKSRKEFEKYFLNYFVGFIYEKVDEFGVDLACRCAELALESYNEEQGGADYVLVECKSIEPVFSTHFKLNVEFYARAKDEPTEQLFSALVATGDTPKVLDCRPAVAQG